MTNSDYLLKATVKKLGDKINQTFLEKIEDATIAAQEVPEIIKKELEALKDEIIKEAKRMETLNQPSNHDNESKTEDNIINKALTKIKEINEKLEVLNIKLDN
tara:strand:- start:42 stop:350 length:309 start_codon:yes stop_codon:yes gene_type:complete